MIHPVIVHVGVLVGLAGLSAVSAHAAEPAPARRTELVRMVRQDCGSCHGMTLKGGLGPSLLPGDLHGKPDAFLVTTILEGRQGTAMPGWARFMSRDEAVWIVGKLRNGFPALVRGALPEVAQ